MIDLDAIVAKLADATVERLRPMVEETLKAAFAAKAAPRTYFAPELAKRFGKSPDAFRMWLKRGGRDVAALASSVGGRPSWSADTIDAYLSKRCAK